MIHMFRAASTFNHPLNSWQVGQVTTFQGMFYSASAFNQDISAWKVNQASSMAHMFQSSNLSECSKLAIHTSFAAQAPSVWPYDWIAVCQGAAGGL